MTTEAHRQCNETGVSFEQTFRYQYIVTKEALDIKEFIAHELGNINIYTGDALDVTKLVGKGNITIGYCLGIASLGARGMVAADSFAHIKQGQDFFHKFENELVDISGRYAFIISDGQTTRYYVDPVGMIGAVYAPENRRIASSPLLAIDRPVVPDPLFDIEDVKTGKGTYGLLHTQDSYVSRLNANFYLDIDNFSQARFWPREEDKFEIDEDEYLAAYREIIEKGHQHIANIARKYPTSMPLTGGNDSRLLFALAGDARKDIDQYFSHINTYANRRDAAFAAELCHSKGLEHETHDKKRANLRPFVRRQMMKQYTIGAGGNLPIPLEVRHGLVTFVKPDSVVMRGHQTNIMRGQYLLSVDPSVWEKTEWQIRIMRMVNSETYTDAETAKFEPILNAIIASLPENAKKRRADFLFFETLVPTALGILFLGQNLAFYISPFNSRRLVQLSMSFDTRYRMENNTTNDILYMLDPEIAEIPFFFEAPPDLSDMSPSAESKARVKATKKRVEAMLNAEKKST